MAALAGVGRLVLVHAPPSTPDEGLRGARERFEATRWGADGDRIVVD